MSATTLQPTPPACPFTGLDEGPCSAAGLVNLTAQMAADVAGDRHRTMAEAFLHHLQPDTRFQSGAGVGVPKFMTPLYGEPRRDCETLEKLAS